MTTILVSAPYMLPHMDRFGPVLKDFGLDWIIPEVHERLSENEILQYAGKFDGAICGDDRYTEPVIQACLPRLKVISKWGTGIDSIDLQAAKKVGVIVGNTPNAFTVPVAESIIAYMLNFVRIIPWLDDAMRRGEWNKSIAKTLSECTLGVIGVGNVGKAVLRRARPFGMRLLGNDIIEVAPDFLVENGVSMVSLEELLHQADFISINCTLNPTSQHLLNTDAFNKCKQEAVVINTARGPIINEADLVDALITHRIAGAALDVFEVEPLPLDSPLRLMDNVMLAPHNSNSSPFYWERVHWNTLRNLLIGLGLNADNLQSYQ